MKNTLIVGLMALVILSGCKKDLDLNSDSYFGIKEFLKSENCDADCGETAACEGKMVQLTGILDENNINQDVHQFWILDKKKDKYSVFVEVDTIISEAVFEKIMAWGGDEIKIVGKVTGYDTHLNFSCDREYSLTLDDVNDIFK